MYMALCSISTISTSTVNNSCLKNRIRKNNVITKSLYVSEVNKIKKGLVIYSSYVLINTIGNYNHRRVKQSLCISLIIDIGYTPGIELWFC